MSYSPVNYRYLITPTFRLPIYYFLYSFTLYSLLFTLYSLLSTLSSLLSPLSSARLFFL